MTNNDGRCDAPLVDGDAFIKGRYRLVFYCADYLHAQGDKLPDIPFLEDVVIAFGIDNETQHYHVPLLLSASRIFDISRQLTERLCEIISVSFLMATFSR